MRRYHRKHEQNTLPRADIDVTLVLDIRHGGFVHEVSADIVLPEITHNL
jgi:hypothetical protein